jgi:flavin reductase (DIM6/NTAB) family NADH-FMN oxidoreductase RutF
MPHCSTVTAQTAVAGQLWGSIDLQARSLRTLFGTYPTGVAIVTTRAPEGRPVGLTISSFASLSLEPPLVLWSLGLQSANLDVFRDCTYFAINVLDRRDEGLARQFATPSIKDKFSGVTADEAPEGVPTIASALTTLVCAHDDSRIAGDHLLMIGRVVRTASRAGEPLVFHAGRFTTLPDTGAPGSSDRA